MLMMKLILKKIISSKSGQTAVEYVVLIAVMASLTVMVLNKVRDFLIGPGGECPNESLFCRILDGATGAGALGEGFRYFTLRR
ncbi:MAG: hypothetical protein HQK50_04775 [Oligoflexia bacterium]|nr:hypothetical protein [Oligoflexia bacterium]MBF0364860.1 hypothetical protein [Oligoflexia bacterium]